MTKYGITDVKEILHNPSYEVLFEEETKGSLEGYEKGQVTELGAVNVMTGIYTGRSPKDKFFVYNEASKDNVWWTSDEYKNDNKPCSEEAWADLKAKAVKQLSGNREELLDVHAQAPDMELVFTETSIGTWNRGNDLSLALNRDMEEVGLGTVNNWCKAVIVWNLVLDSDRGPHGGPGACATCYGAVDVDNETYTRITRNSHYYLLAHLASVVKPGAVRIGTSGTLPEGLAYAAFENADGTYAFVLSNPTETTQRFAVEDGTHSYVAEVPAKALASYRWQK